MSKMSRRIVYPKHSKYGVFTCIYLPNVPNVDK